MAGNAHPARSGLNVIIAIVACYLAFLAWGDARIAYLRVTDSVAALTVRPNDPFALGKMMDARLAKAQNPSISDKEIEAVRAALKQAPLSRALLRIIGAKAESQGNMARADAAMGLSDKVSRRDALTQLWLIERSVSKDDMNGALRHYHAVLSTHPELGPALFPVLTKAIAFPEVRDALRPYLAQQARWIGDLLNVAITSGNPADVARLVIPEGDVLRGEAYEALNARLITKLAETGNFPLARQVAMATIAKTNGQALKSFEVNENTVDTRLGGLAWTLADDGTVLALPNGDGGFNIDVEPLARGVAASRMLPVIAGRRYSFAQTLRATTTEAQADLNWQAYCLSAQPKTLIWQQILPKSRGRQRYQSTLSIPATCMGVELVLQVRGPEGQQAAHPIFEQLAFGPSLD